jgi:predicted MFS family arabinose efflux permease
LGALVYALTAASGAGTPLSSIAAAAAVGCALIVCFVFVERRAADPIMPLTLFASPVFSGVNLATLLLYGGLGGLFYFLPFDLIQAHGYSPASAGLAMLPFVIPLSLISRVSARALTRTGPRVLLSAGTAIVTAGFLLLALLPRSMYWLGVFPPILIIGIGMGFVVAPLTTTVMNAVPREHVGLASGVNNAVSRVGGLLAIAVAGAIIWGAFNAAFDAAIPSLHVDANERAHIEQERSRLAGGNYGDARVQLAVFEAYDASFNDVALLCAGLAAAASLAAYLMLGSASPRRASQPTSH